MRSIIRRTAELLAGSVACRSQSYVAWPPALCRRSGPAPGGSNVRTRDPEEAAGAEGARSEAATVVKANS